MLRVGRRCLFNEVRKCVDRSALVVEQGQPSLSGRSWMRLFPKSTAVSFD